MGRRAVDADGDLGVVVTGDHNSTTTIMGDVIVRGARQAPTSVYEAEIRILAAARFQGREKELAEMSAFALGEDPHSSPYWRWLAPAWSGKTALMAHFALNPPPGVRVLAFFITARLAGRSDRTAFLSELRQQLRAFLEDSDLDCTGYADFHDALSRAADRARERGERLVLMVDGMDEDSGVESAFAGYSIASLLPGAPPDGLRVIVAGRPNPPVPGDVSGGHPLRTTDINHDLAESPAARAVREDAERSLHEMITAGGLCLDLVGLTCAAGGGLSAADLALLIGDHTPRQIEAVLGGATGRSFQLRPAQWILSDGRHPSLYSFAHQELLISAGHLLRPSVLRHYRDRVHEFVRAYQEKGWPADTPEYALTGYPQMLRKQRDTRRLTDLATDPARHERLWHTAGSDTGALTEIADAFALHREEPDADLVSCVRLSHCRDELRYKATSFPAEALVVLARLGHVRKATALLGARTGFSPSEAQLFGRVLREALVSGEEALVLSAVRALVDPSARDQALRSCADALADAGQADEAAELCQHIDALADRSHALAYAAAKLTQGGSESAIGMFRDATEAARSVGEPVSRTAALAVVMEKLTDADRGTEAAGLTAEVIDAVRALTGPLQRTDALSAVVDTLARVGRAEEAAVLVRAAAQAAGDLTDPEDRGSTLEQSAYVLARAGHVEEAVRLTRIIGEPKYRSGALIYVVEGAVSTSRPEEAVGPAQEAAGMVADLVDPEERDTVLDQVTRALATAGRAREATRFAHMMNDSERRALALLGVADLLMKAERPQEAVVLARNVIETAGELNDQADRTAVLVSAVEVLVKAGKTEEAARLARSLDGPEPRTAVLCSVAWQLAEAGLLDEATRYCRSAAEASGAISDARQRAGRLLQVARIFRKAGWTQEATAFGRTAADAALIIGASAVRATVLVDVARVLADVGQTEDAIRHIDIAIEVSRTAPDPDRTVRSGLAVARALAEAGRTEEAMRLVRHAVDTVGTVKNTGSRVRLLWYAAQVWVTVGRTQEAVRLADLSTRLGRGHVDPDDQARALAIVAGALAERGQTEDAVRLAHTAGDLARTTVNPQWRSWALADVAKALAKAGRIDDSIRLARTLTESDDQAEALAAATRALAAAGRPEEAAGLARSARDQASGTPNVSYRVRALAEVARTLAAIGRPDEAVEVAETLTRDESAIALGIVAGALGSVAETLADAGHPEEAVRLADRAGDLLRTTHDASFRASATTALAQALAKAGHLDRAAEFADITTRPTAQATALAAVARAHGASAEGRSLLRRALTLTSHEDVLDELATLSPEALDEALRCVTP
ncbi:tetratricopeptide repeat protein [Streptomyces sp. NPDC023723]|uniref:tetratricopeptide repeat protein n=1 Tax=Streptomyces sp. NPDC023723 TaxID=3154323 RepID=UPI0033C86002